MAGLGYAASSIISDINSVGEHNLAVGAIALLGLALPIALGFEFVNGFHDTVNAVATVIGSIMGVGLANQLLAPAGSAMSGVDWARPSAC